jgi:hypothetical protein
MGPLFTDEFKYHQMPEVHEKVTGSFAFNFVDSVGTIFYVLGRD